MRKIGRCEVSLKVNHDVITALKKKHVGYKVRMEWGIGGLKRKMEMIDEKVWVHKT
jgi:hypothetical protein